MLFKNTFQENRKNISNYFKEGADVKLWEFGNELVFTRLDKFVERLQVVEVNLLNGCIPILFLMFLSSTLELIRSTVDDLGVLILVWWEGLAQTM